MEMEKGRMDTEHFIYEKECLKFPVKTAAPVCLLKQSLWFWGSIPDKFWYQKSSGIKHQKNNGVMISDRGMLGSYVWPGTVTFVGWETCC